MKRFLGIFATALLFLFLFTFFGGSYFLDIQRHFDAMNTALQNAGSKWRYELNGALPTLKKQ